MVVSTSRSLQKVAVWKLLSLCLTFDFPVFLQLQQATCACKKLGLPLVRWLQPLLDDVSKYLIRDSNDHSSTTEQLSRVGQSVILDAKSYRCL